MIRPRQIPLVPGFPRKKRHIPWLFLVLQISRTHMTTPFVSSLGSFDTSYPRPAAPGLASACRWPSKNMLDTSARFVQNLGYGHVEYNLLMDPLRHTVLLVFSFCPLQIPKLFFCPSLAFCNPSYTTPGAFWISFALHDTSKSPTYPSCLCLSLPVVRAWVSCFSPLLLERMKKSIYYECLLLEIRGDAVALTCDIYTWYWQIPPRLREKRKVPKCDDSEHVTFPARNSSRKWSPKYHEP